METDEGYHRDNQGGQTIKHPDPEYIALILYVGPTLFLLMSGSLSLSLSPSPPLPLSLFLSFTRSTEFDNTEAVNLPGYYERNILFRNGLVPTYRQAISVTDVDMRLLASMLSQFGPVWNLHVCCSVAGSKCCHQVMSGPGFIWSTHGDMCIICHSQGTAGKTHIFDVRRACVFYRIWFAAAATWLQSANCVR